MLTTVSQVIVMIVPFKWSGTTNISIHERQLVLVVDFQLHFRLCTRVRECLSFSPINGHIWIHGFGQKGGGNDDMS